MEIGNEELNPAEKSGNIWVRRLAPNLQLMKAWFLLVYLDGSLRGITVPSWWLHWWAGTPGRQSQVTELYQPGLWLTDTHTGRVNTWCAMILYSIPQAVPWSMEHGAWSPALSNATWLGKACRHLFTHESVSSPPTLGGWVYTTKTKFSENHHKTQSDLETL